MLLFDEQITSNLGKICHVLFLFAVLIFSETVQSSTVPDFGHPKSSATGSFSILKPLYLPWFQWCGSKDKHDVTLGPLKGLVVRSPFSLALSEKFVTLWVIKQGFLECIASTG